MFERSSNNFNKSLTKLFLDLYLAKFFIYQQYISLYQHIIMYINKIFSWKFTLISIF